jgi:Transposase, Mutator family
VEVSSRPSLRLDATEVAGPEPRPAGPQLKRPEHSNGYPSSTAGTAHYQPQREAHEDWLQLGRDLIARGLGAPMLIVADGAPGLIKAIEQCWLASDRQRCCVHRARNLYAKLPERERERVKQAYWQARSTTRSARQTPSSDSKPSSTGSRRRASPPRRGVSQTIWTRWSCTCATHLGTAGGGDQRICSSAHWER